MGLLTLATPSAPSFEQKLALGQWLRDVSLLLHDTREGNEGAEFAHIGVTQCDWSRSWLALKGSSLFRA